MPKASGGGSSGTSCFPRPERRGHVEGLSGFAHCADLEASRKTHIALCVQRSHPFLRVALRRFWEHGGGCVAYSWGMKWWVLVLICLVEIASADWRVALPGWRYRFPEDHASHAGFKTEWWYFTGNLKSAEGREFGYQLTFFRQGVREPGSGPVRSRFVVDDMKFAHFAVSDITNSRFHHFQSISRGAFGEAGFDDGARIAWIQDWVCERTGTNNFRLKASEDGVAIDLQLTAEKEPVIHGRTGVSQKAEGEGRASHYYSLTRLATRGVVTVDGKPHEVSGTTWFDHEWATNQLAEHQKGWDWFSLHFVDGTELMIFQIRTEDGRSDPHSAGTFVFEDGTDVQIGQAGFSLEPVGWWRSAKTAANYPVEWRISVPALELSLDIKARFPGQELAAEPFAYWEGAVRATGTRGGKEVEAVGYLEMTGYAGRIVGLQAPGAGK